MQINPNEIVVNDRIRKDFGDIKELADNIAQIGLIEPIVVSTDRPPVLIAGERRLRAVKSLGWDRVEIRTIAVEDAEHALMMEISENEARKEFTMTERLDWGNRLKLVEEAKAKQRQLAGKSLNDVDDLGENFPTGSGRVNEIVAKAVGFGNRKNFEHAQFIADHKADIDPEDFANWDEGRLSTNKVYTALKQKLAEAEGKVEKLEAEKQDLMKDTVDYEKAIQAQHDSKRYMEMKEELEKIRAELREKYEAEQTRKETENNLAVKFQRENADLRKKNDEAATKLADLKAQFEEFKKSASEPKVIEKVPEDYYIIKTKLAKIEENIEKSINERRNPPPSSGNEFYTKLNSAFASFFARYNGVKDNLDYIDKLTDEQQHELGEWVVQTRNAINRVGTFVGGN